MQHVATDNVSAPAAFTGSTFSFSPPVNLFDQHKAFVAVVRRPCSSSSQVCLRQAVVNALPDSWLATYCKNYRATSRNQIMASNFTWIGEWVASCRPVCGAGSLDRLWSVPDFGCRLGV